MLLAPAIRGRSPMPTGTATGVGVNAASSARAEPIQLAELDLTVAVLTFRRPHDLATILPLLGAQLRAAGPLLHHARILVVDDSPDGEARAAVAGFAGEPGPVDA